jgi:hypothetical protein
MPRPTLTLRGELHCFACARYLGDFEAHPEDHGAGDIHFIKPEFGELPARAVPSDKGLRCSVCGGRVVAEHVDRVAA